MTELANIVEQKEKFSFLLNKNPRKKNQLLESDYSVDFFLISLFSI